MFSVKDIVMISNLTRGDLDWLREIRGAADAKRDPPRVPMGTASALPIQACLFHDVNTI